MKVNQYKVYDKDSYGNASARKAFRKPSILALDHCSKCKSRVELDNLITSCIPCSQPFFDNVKAKSSPFPKHCCSFDCDAPNQHWRCISKFESFAGVVSLRRLVVGYNIKDLTAFAPVMSIWFAKARLYLTDCEIWCSSVSACIISSWYCITQGAQTC